MATSKSTRIPTSKGPRRLPKEAPPPVQATSPEKPLFTWSDAIKAINPYIVKIHTPSGSGTGFMVVHAKKSKLVGIATAAHVIAHAHYWEEPIRLDHHASGKSAFLRNNNRAVICNDDADTASLVLEDDGKIEFPSVAPDIIAPDKYVGIGREIGWLGFPAIASNHLCFFTGRTSAWVSSQNAYLVDGVAINGVSGGPAFSLLPTGWRLIGIVTAYIPNRVTGVALPGLCEIRDVAPLQSMITTLKDMEEAKEKETQPSSPPTQPQAPTSQLPPGPSDGAPTGHGKR